MSNKGNTQGILVNQPAMSGNASSANPPVKPEVKEEAGWWETGLDWFQTGLDVVGLIPGVGEIADGANALIYTARGDYVNAGLSAAAMIPFAGWAATGTKVGMKGAKAIGKEVAEEVVEEVGEKVAKEAAEKTAKETAEKKAQQEAKAQAAKKAEDTPDGKEKNKVKKQKPKKNCGKFGKYKDTKKHSAGEGRSDPERLQVDHVPSKRALQESAENKFRELTGKSPNAAQKKYLKSMTEKEGYSITIPSNVHKNGRTHGRKNTSDVYQADAKNLDQAMLDDMEAIQNAMDQADNGCSDKYKQAADAIKKMKKPSQMVEDIVTDYIKTLK